MSQVPNVLRISAELTAPQTLDQVIAHLQNAPQSALIIVSQSAVPSQYLSVLFANTAHSAALVTKSSEPGPRAVIIANQVADVDRHGEAIRGAAPSIIALKISPADNQKAIETLREFRFWIGADDHLNPGGLAFALARDGMELAAVDAYPWAAQYAKPARDLRWQRAVRGQDGLLSTLALRPVSLQVSKLAVRVGISPNFLTMISLLLALAAAGMLATGQLLWTATASFLLYVSLVLDCSDGEVARFTETASPVGGWLDAFTDRIKEHGLLAGLALGATMQGAPAWITAGIAVGVITTRHLASFAFIDTILPDQRPQLEPRSFAAPLRAPHAPFHFGQRPGLAQTSVRGWVSRVLHAPVSERWAVLGAGALIFDARGALIAYSVYVGLSLILTTGGWVLRTRKLLQNPSKKAVETVAYIRDGILKSPRPRSRWLWLAAPSTMIIETGVLLALGVSSLDTRLDIAPLVFFVLVAMSWLRYERAYGGKYGVSWQVSKYGGGWLFRTSLWLITLVLWQLDITVPFATILLAATGWLFALVVLDAILTWWNLRLKEPR